MTDAVHDFGDELDFSHSLSDMPWWEPVYRRAFPDFKAMVDLREKGWGQQGGRDRAIMLTGGTVVYTDEKGRRPRKDGTDWPDIALEVWSVYPKGENAARYPAKDGAVLGWARKPLDCDYLAYAFVASEVCHLLPFQGIRAAFERYGREWGEEAADNFARRQAGEPVSGVVWARASNRRYDTVNLCVPTTRLWDAVSGALMVSWQGLDYEPKPTLREERIEVPTPPALEVDGWPEVRRPADWRPEGGGDVA